MRIRDITVPLSAETPVYPGDPQVVISSLSSVAQGDLANVSHLTLSTHSGTHIDPPRHFFDDGISVDELPMELLIGKALVVEISGAKEIGQEELSRLPVRGVERLLLKTENSELWKGGAFQREFVSLGAGGARYLLECGVRLLGIDYLSVEKVDGDGGVHRILLEKGVPILEGIDLSGVAPGEYELICLPMKIKGGDGAPVRAILRGGQQPSGAPAFDPHTTKWPLA